MRAEADDAFEGGGAGLDFLQDPVGLLARRWRWMLASLLLGLLATAAFVLSREPRYYAQATVMISRQQLSRSIVEPTIEEDSLTRIDAMAAKVLASASLQKVVEQFDLYPELRQSATLSDVVSRLRGDVTIQRAPTMGPAQRNESAQIFEIGFEADRPVVAADVANSLAQLFVDASIEGYHRQQHLATEFLRRELTQAERLLREQDGKITELKRESRGLLPNELDSNLAKLDVLQQQRQSLSLQIAEAEARMVTLSSSVDDSPDARLIQLRDKLREELSQYTEKHPSVAVLRREIEAVEQEIVRSDADPRPATSRAELRKAAEGTVEVLLSQLASVEAELVELDQRIGRMPAVAEALAALEEKGTIYRESYLDFLRKVQDAVLAENLLLAQQGERVSIVNPATPPSAPSRSLQKWFLVAIVASFGFAGAVGLALEALDPVLATASQVEAIAELPVIGSVDPIG